MRKRNIFYISFFLGIILLVFRNWFLAPQIIGGDWPYIFEETLKNYSFYFSSWNPFRGNGLGGLNPFYSLGVFHGFTVFLSQTLHISWPLTYKFSWFGLFIGLSVFSSMYLLKTVLREVKFWQRIFASIIFSTNTYILMVVSGGQMGVALAYSIAPLVLASFIKLIGNLASVPLNFKFQISNFKFPIVAGLVLAIQVMFDPRIAYLTLIAVAIYLVLRIKRGIFNIFFLLLYSIAIPIGIAILLHGAWILSVLFLQSNPDPQGLTSVSGFSFLSFADFSHAFSLLHPNWPENVFGKTYFLKPEFLMLPILAYSPLLFIKSNIKNKISKIQIKDQRYNNNLTIEQFNNRTILFFAFLGLIGAFLAKGANPPFGEINIFLFEHIPGMNMFRDPTKFYLLVALSYSVLIPFSISYIYNWLISNIKYQKSNIQSKYQIFNFSYVFLIFTILYLLFLIRPALLGELGGTFKMYDVPKEYVELKDFLYNQKEYFRTLWVPRQQRFSFVSDIHPAIEAEPLFDTRSAEVLSKMISSEQGQSLLSKLSVKYVLIQYDSLEEQFLEDRKYSEEQRMEYEIKLDTIPWLKKIRSGKIAVYETPLKKDHFFLDGVGKISAVAINPMHYVLTVSIDQPQRLIFSENFHPKWQLILNDRVINAEKTDEGLNSFLLSKGDHQGNVIFSGDKYYTYGKIIALSTLGLAVILLFVMHKKKVYNT